tara:strand:- start:1716 stop:1850 length:135 start_codon:yes stop_codon:yes gene_type:complete
MQSRTVGIAPLNPPYACSEKSQGSQLGKEDIAAASSRFEIGEMN